MGASSRSDKAAGTGGLYRGTLCIVLEVIIISVVTRLLFAETRRCGVSLWWTALGPLLYLVGEFQGALVWAYLGREVGSVFFWGLSFGAAGVLVAWALIVFHPLRNHSSSAPGRPTSR